MVSKVVIVVLLGCVWCPPAQHISDGGMTNQGGDVVRPWLNILYLVSCKEIPLQTPQPE
jgi:hypothetical protein